MEHESIVSHGFCDFSYDRRLYVASMNTDAAAAVAAGVLNVAVVVVVVVVVDPVVDASVYWYPPDNFHLLLHLLLILCV